MTYLTAGEKEVRAWTIKKGTKAPQAAAVIHTDFEKNFIRAEVGKFEDIKKYQGFKQAKEAGLIKIEGKNYIFQDGDLVYFHINNR